MRWIILLLAAGIVFPAAGEAAAPYLYGSPTVGLWRWDNEAYAEVDLQDETALVLGGRIGYAPIDAFSGELVILTGSNDLTSAATGPASIRLTQFELSFLVNFRTLFETPAYPFLDLGVGGLTRRSDAEVLDDSHFAFHLGGGVKVDLHERAAIRLNVRDTFFTDTREINSLEVQTTVDAVELSIGLEYRVPLAGTTGGRRLR